MAGASRWSWLWSSSSEELCGAVCNQLSAVRVMPLPTFYSLIFFTLIVVSCCRAVDEGTNPDTFTLQLFRECTAQNQIR